MQHYAEINFVTPPSYYDCPICHKLINHNEKCVNIDVNLENVWVHVECFAKLCEPVLEKLRAIDKFKQLFKSHFQFR